MTPSPRFGRRDLPTGWRRSAVLHDPDQAKDAVQETLVRAWRDLRTLRDPDRFDAWLHRLLVNSCLNEAKRLRRHRFDVELDPLSGPSTQDGAGALADRDELSTAGSGASRPTPGRSSASCTTTSTCPCRRSP